MRRISAFCAAALLGLTALAATSPAQAGFHLIRWHGTGFCQVWDDGIPTKPFPSDYKRVSAQLPTVAAALAVKDHLMHRGACKI
jgi:hypothetical protein